MITYHYWGTNWTRYYKEETLQEANDKFNEIYEFRMGTNKDPEYKMIGSIFERTGDDLVNYDKSVNKNHEGYSFFRKLC